MKILCIGDIFAKPGREVLKSRLPSLVDELAADFVIVNCENAARGRGITPKLLDEFADLPIDIFTSGNHIWQHDSINDYLNRGKVLRPHNAAGTRAGSGIGYRTARNGHEVAVINLQGRVHMYEGDKMASPFAVAKTLVAEARARTPIIVVDFHAEITAEKQALGHWLDGHASCVYGTHTHVQTADEKVLPGGTAYITDIGMTGPHGGVIGMQASDALHRFTDGKDGRGGWHPAQSDVQIQGICVEIDDATGRAVTIMRVQCRAD